MTVNFEKQYGEAYTLADRGVYDEARQRYKALAASVSDAQWRAVIANDLAILSAISGDVQDARERLHDALDIDEHCAAARANLRLLEEVPDQDVKERRCSASPSASTHDRPIRSGLTKVAILSFLFNWPSTGGGIIHTVELTRFLAEAGFDVRLYYPQYEPWQLGNVDSTCPVHAKPVTFVDSQWNIAAIKARFREAVDAFAPETVIITDCWNFKPHLADAVRDYRYFIRMQALECLCPLNNLRLLPDEKRRFRQCENTQLATPSQCYSCLERHSWYSGRLHQAERALSGVGAPEYLDLLRRTLQNADAVLVLNQETAKLLSPHLTNVRVATWGMDPTRFPWPHGAEARDERQLHRLFFAALVPESIKGFDILHAACERLWQRRQDFELVATGDPPGRVDEFTRYVGWLSQDELPKHYRSSDITIVPTIAQEGLSRTAVEAMASGRPVIASRIGGLPDSVTDGLTGFLTEPGNVEDLAERIDYLLDRPNLQREMGLAGRRRFEQDYGWPAVIQRTYLPMLSCPKQNEAAGPPRFVPFLPERVDHERLIEDVKAFFGLDPTSVSNMFELYRAIHEAKGYAESLGELKTLSFEEAFVIYVTLALTRPESVVEIGIQYGKSTRRMLDINMLLGLNARFTCFDVHNEVQHFAMSEARLILKDVTGRFREEALEALRPGFLFLDTHAYCLIEEIVRETLRWPTPCVLAIHDCSRGLCNPRMTLSKEDSRVTSRTGHWERYVLAHVLGIDDPFSKELDDWQNSTHRFRVFQTQHGLGVLCPTTFCSTAPSTGVAC